MEDENHDTIFHPTVQQIIEDAIVLIRSGEIDSGLEKLESLLCLTTALEKRPPVMVMNKFYETCMKFVLYEKYPFNVWVKILLGNWFLDGHRQGLISEETLNKFIKNMQFGSKEQLMEDLENTRIGITERKRI